MTAINPKELFDLIIAACARGLLDVGFVRRGASLRKASSGNVAVIEFQKSTKSNADKILFTINLGVISSQLLELEKSSSKGVGISSAHLRQRIGMLMPDRPDKWWTIEPSTAAGALVDEISSLLGQVAAPYLDRHLSDDALAALWDSGQSPGLTEGQRRRYLSMLDASRASAG